MKLHDVNQGIQKNKKRRRVGRGPGSGHGKTAGRGHNGQKSRAGLSQRATFQGGAMPMVRRIPKRGFNNKFALEVFAINVSQLEKSFEDGDTVSPETLREKDIVKPQSYDVLKILGNGELSKKLNVSAHRFSASAAEKIAQAGGSTTVLPGKAPVVKGQKKADRSAE